jgi:peptidoglycan hydrolase-like protein with peptidoglycan-binding domain
MILSTLKLRLPPTVVALGASLAVALTVSVPQPARADRGGLIAGAIVAGAVICATNPKACGGGNRNGGGGGGGGGTGDAIALDRDQKMMIQSGLQNLGFYSGAIDGSIGAGTRGSIRSYQTAVGAPATGGLTGVQINDLIALSPRYVRYPLGDVNLFTADVAPDLDRDGVAQLQAALNRAGYDAGPVDGAMGGRTRDAIRLYKINNGLPGPALPTRRLLAHLQGYEAPLPAGIEMASMRPQGFDGGAGYMAGMNSGAGTGAGLGANLSGGGNVPVAAPQTAPDVMAQGNKTGQGKQTGGAPVVVARAETVAPSAPAAPVAPAAMDLEFDILGAKLGSDTAALDQVLKVELGADLLSGEASAAEFGGNATLAAARQWLQPTWHQAPAEQVIALSDPARPELGALALIRLVRLPASVDQAVFDQHVLPEMLAYYGETGRVGDSLSWIGNGEARAAALTDPAALAACGDLKLASVPDVAAGMDGLWIKGGGIFMDTASLDSVSKSCGSVVKVSFQPGLLTIGLWNADALNGAAAIPVIKF